MDRSSGSRGALAGAVVILNLWLGAGAGAAAEGPRISGTVSGGLSAGSRLAIRIDAAQVGGWQRLHRLDAILVVGGREVETLAYDVEDRRVAVGAEEVLAGTGGSIAGSYLGVSGADVVVTTGGANLSLAATANLLRAVPSDARFRLRATDDAGRTATVTRAVDTGKPGGAPSWEAVAVTVAIALVAGAFVGNLFASRRRPPPRLSVYSTIKRRIDEERSAGDPAA